MSVKSDYDPEQEHIASLENLRKLVALLSKEVEAKPELLDRAETLVFQTVQSQNGEKVSGQVRGWRLPYLDEEIYLIPELDGIVTPLENREVGELILFDALVVDIPEDKWFLRKPPKYLLEYYDVEYACVALLLNITSTSSDEPGAYHC